jgi:L,D-peptidoglycan transpeptidase YkuD (ErfK/YbiS/YcfS/YnhG family)
MRVRCALGRSGATRNKREGDGATPIGSFALLQMFYRPDKIPRPRTLLPTRRIAPDNGWCDAPQDRAYNTLVKRPYPASHEEMWRGDDMYDLVLDIDYNRGGAFSGRP